ncbi:hypothetical protein, partial [Bacillus smithii]|uniref:hypothetical protein n=1 Tax=Bacillus smithii TaxID=1479 RepID=UPI003D1BCB4F
NSRIRNRTYGGVRGRELIAPSYSIMNFECIFVCSLCQQNREFFSSQYDFMVFLSLFGKDIKESGSYGK